MPEGEEQDQGQDPEPRMIPADALPEDLQDKEPEEIKNTLGLLGKALESRSQETQELRQELRELRSKVESAPQGPEEPEEPEVTEEELKELAVDDPVKAVDAALSKLGYKDQFEAVGGQANAALGEAAFLRASQEIADFSEHEQEVREILEETGANPNLNNIENAYNLVLGQKYRQERQRAKKKRSTSEEPSPPKKEEEEEKPSLEPGSLHAQIADALDVDEDDLEEYGGEGPLQMDVPTGEVRSAE